MSHDWRHKRQTWFSALQHCGAYCRLGTLLWLPQTEGDPHNLADKGPPATLTTDTCKATKYKVKVNVMTDTHIVTVPSGK